MTPNEQKRKEDFVAAVKAAGCTIDIERAGKFVMVPVPGQTLFSVGFDQTKEIDSYLATGMPPAAEIIAAAIKEAVDTDYFPARSYMAE